MRKRELGSGCTAPECCGNKEAGLLAGRVGRQPAQAGEGQEGGGRGTGSEGKESKERGSLVGETPLFRGKNKGDGEKMEVAYLSA